MNSHIVTRTKTVVVSIIAAASFATMAVPFFASAAPAVVATTAAGPVHSGPNDTPWP